MRRIALVLAALTISVGSFAMNSEHCSVVRKIKQDVSFEKIDPSMYTAFFVSGAAYIFMEKELALFLASKNSSSELCIHTTKDNPMIDRELILKWFKITRFY